MSSDPRARQRKPRTANRTPGTQANPDTEGKPRNPAKGTEGGRTHRLRKRPVRRDPRPPSGGSRRGSGTSAERETARASALAGPQTRQLLKALAAWRKGNFSVRLPEEWVGIEGKVAEAFNDAVELNQRLTRELQRLARVAGKEGKLGERATLGGAGGGLAG